MEFYFDDFSFVLLPLPTQNHSKTSFFEASVQNNRDDQAKSIRKKLFNSRSVELLKTQTIVTTTRRWSVQLCYTSKSRRLKADKAATRKLLYATTQPPHVGAKRGFYCFL